MAEIEQDEARLNQEWGELLDELRVVLPGAEVLFAFLLTVPFSQRFGEIARTDKSIYFLAFLAAAISTLLLTAPGAQHRLIWRRGAKDRQLRLATRLAIAGTAFAAVAVASVVFLVTDVLYTNATAATVTAGVVGLIVWTWYGQPLLMRARSEPRGPAAEAPGRETPLPRHRRGSRGAR